MWYDTRNDVYLMFVWAGMLTPLLPAGRREENTALIRCNSNT